MATIKYKDENDRLVTLGAGLHTHSPSDIGAAEEGHGHDVATETNDGFLSAADKNKINRTNDYVFGNAQAGIASLVDLVGDQPVSEQISTLAVQTMHYTINASTVMDDLSLYTNVLPYALASGGQAIYSDTGYKVNTRLSTSSRVDQAENNVSITGFIPVKTGDVIRLKNISIPKTTQLTGLIHTFTDMTNESVSATLSVAYFPTSMNVVCGNDGSYTQFTIPDISPAINFIRIQAFEFRQGATITINEPINNPNTDFLPITDSYTNVLREAQEADSENVYNTLGYVSGKRLSSANPNNESAVEGMCVSGYIPYSEGQIIRIYKAIPDGTASSYIAFYDENKKWVSITSFNACFADINGVYTYANYNNKCKYFRLSIGTIDDKTLVTLNERFDPAAYDCALNGTLPGEPI